MTIRSFIAIAASAPAGFAAAGSAVAQAISKAKDGQLGFMEPATPIMERLTDFHTMLLVIITAIVLLVAGLLAWVIFRYNSKANPEPSKVSHNTLIEVVWTVVPVLILVVIAIPSFRLLYAQDRIPEADLVIKATGHQWYWTYEYPDYDNMTFDAIMLPERYFDDPATETQAERTESEGRLARFLGRADAPSTYRLLDTDTRVVVPVDTVVKVLVTASDVLHSWTVPAFGIKMDAVPGRLNETWFKATQTGTFYGQCSEICGIRHSFMPIVVEVVTQEEFDRWAELARQEYAQAPVPPRTRMAAAR